MLARLFIDMLFLSGKALLDSGKPARALPRLAIAARLARSNPAFFVLAAIAARRAGERDRAAGYCDRALALNPELQTAHDLLSEMFLHGEDYFQVLERLHEYLRPRTYIEIGVETGASLRLVQPGTAAIGIDPQPVLCHELPAGVRMFTETSDDFFARRDAHAELGGVPLDLALIDGMHHFEYALRDFMNLEPLCGPQSVILIHDCFPHDRRTALRERVLPFWSGDVWRLLVLLKKYRPDLSIHTIATPPTGLAVVRNLNPASRFIAGNLERLTREFMALDYAYLESDRSAKLNLYPNDWERIRALLPAAA
jgi:tetratricopeptide (TPR) repeat protein